MRILSWNLYCSDGDDRSRIRTAVNYCQTLAPDIVIFQEACEFGDNNFRSSISKQLDMRPHVSLAMTGYHVAAFVKRNISCSIRSLNNVLHHSAVAIRSSDGDLGLVDIVGVHLCPDTPGRRAQEMRWILKKFSPESRAIIIGDFNSPHPASDSAAVNQLPDKLRCRYVDKNGSLDPTVHMSLAEAGFRDAGADSESQISTFPTPGPVSAGYAPMRLDYAFTSKQLSMDVSSFKVLSPRSSIQISDHRPILVTLGRNKVQ